MALKARQVVEPLDAEGAEVAPHFLVDGKDVCLDCALGAEELVTLRTLE